MDGVEDPKISQRPNMTGGSAKRRRRLRARPPPAYVMITGSGEDSVTGAATRCAGRCVHPAHHGQQRPRERCGGDFSSIPGRPAVQPRRRCSAAQQQPVYLVAERLSITCADRAESRRTQKGIYRIVALVQPWSTERRPAGLQIARATCSVAQRPPARCRPSRNQTLALPLGGMTP